MAQDLDAATTGSQSVAEFGADSAAMVNKIRETQHPLILTQEGQGVAALVDIESYRNLLDELDLLRDVQRGLADIEAGRVVPHKEVRQLLHLRYGS